MKKFHLSFIGLCLGLSATIGFGGTMGAQSKPAAPFKGISPTALYSYLDFKYNATNSMNYLRYQGHSNIYAVGAEQISVIPGLWAGLYYMRLNTTVNSQSLITPSPLSLSQQDSHSNIIFGHILKQLTPRFFADIAGLYGQNKLATTSSLFPENNLTQYAYSNNKGNNWLATLTGLYKQPLGRFMLNADVRVVYSKIDQNGYLMNFPRQPVIVPAISNKTTMLFENAELGYLLSPSIQPFINAGLIQVVSFSNNRPIAEGLVGPLPQFNLDTNGYKVGGGLAVVRGNLRVRLEQQYMERTSLFRSNQTTVTLQYHFN